MLPFFLIASAVAGGAYVVAEHQKQSQTGGSTGGGYSGGSGNSFAQDVTALTGLVNAGVSAYNAVSDSETDSFDAP